MFDVRDCECLSCKKKWVEPVVNGVMVENGEPTETCSCGSSEVTLGPVRSQRLVKIERPTGESYQGYDPVVEVDCMLHLLGEEGVEQTVQHDENGEPVYCVEDWVELPAIWPPAMKAMLEASKSLEAPVFHSAHCNYCDGTVPLIVQDADLTEFLFVPRTYRRKMQDLFPYLDAGQREVLISFTCNECFDELFGGSEE